MTRRFEPTPFMMFQSARDVGNEANEMRVHASLEATVVNVILIGPATESNLRCIISQCSKTIPSPRVQK